MRAQMTITDLDQERWDYLQRNVRAEYEIPSGVTRLCLTFRRGDEERHAEMPLGVIIGLLVGLGMTGTFKAFVKAMEKIKEAGQEDTNAQSAPYGFGPDGSVVALDQVVRNDCAFCGRERVAPKDDNHAPECPYWSVGPGSLVKDEDLPKWLKDELDRRHELGEFPDWKRP